MNHDKVLELKTGELIWNNESGDLLRVKAVKADSAENRVTAEVIFSVAPDKAEKTISHDDMILSYEKLETIFDTLSAAQRAVFGLLMVDVNSIKMALVQSFANQQDAQVVKKQSPGGIIY